MTEYAQTYKCCMIQRFHGGINRRYGNLTLRRAKDKSLSGTMFPTMFWLDASFSQGSWDEDAFSFTAHWGTPCQQFSMQVEGVADGKTLKGRVYSPMGEYELEGVII